MKELAYRFELELESTPEQLWPLVSDTNRFNRDAGVPFVEQLKSEGRGRRLRLSKFGVGVAWDEEPFEWIRPYRFGVVRRYTSGPVAEMRVTAALLRVADRLLALLDLAADELRDVGLGELVAPATAAPAALDLQVLDRGHNPAQHHDLVASPGAHRVLQALLDAGFTEGVHFPVPIS